MESAGVHARGSMHSKRQSFCTWKASLPVVEKPWFILPECALCQGSSFSAAMS